MRWPSSPVDRLFLAVALSIALALLLAWMAGLVVFTWCPPRAPAGPPPDPSVILVA